MSNRDPTNYLTSAHHLTVTVNSDSIVTVVPDRVERLAPGQSQLVQVGVKNKSGVSAGTTCSGTIVASYTGSRNATRPVSGVCGIGDYDASTTSLNYHGTPD